MEKPPKKFLKAKCHTFEVHHGNEDTYIEMLQNKRSFCKLQSDLQEEKEELNKAGFPEDEMASLERQLMAPMFATVTPKDGGRQLGFVSAGVISKSGEIRGNQ